MCEAIRRIQAGTGKGVGCEAGCGRGVLREVHMTGWIALLLVEAAVGHFLWLRVATVPRRAKRSYVWRARRSRRSDGTAADGIKFDESTWVQSVSSASRTELALAQKLLPRGTAELAARRHPSSSR
eukprot:5119230-Prymnesium_polylepis.1